MCRCFAEVRKAMGREKIKRLYAADEKRVDGYCSLGNVDNTVGYIAAIGAHSRCVQAVDDLISSNRLAVAEDNRGQAYSICRQGGINKALEVVTGSSAEAPDRPSEIVAFAASSAKTGKGEAVTLCWGTAHAVSRLAGAMIGKKRWLPLFCRRFADGETSRSGRVCGLMGGMSS